MVRPSSPDRRQVQGLILLLAVVFAALWLNIRRPATADHRQPRLATLSASVATSPPVVLYAVWGKPITGAVMVRQYENGATDRIHPTCYEKAKSDPPVEVAR
jgi:hypothetical protein